MGDNGPNTTEQATAGDGMDKEEKGREGVWPPLLSMGCWDRCRRSGPKEGGSVFVCRSGFKRGSWACSALSSAAESGI